MHEAYNIRKKSCFYKSKIISYLLSYTIVCHNITFMKYTVRNKLIVNKVIYAFLNRNCNLPSALWKSIYESNFVFIARFSALNKVARPRRRLLCSCISPTNDNSLQRMKAPPISGLRTLKKKERRSASMRVRENYSFVSMHKLNQQIINRLYFYKSLHLL